MALIIPLELPQTGVTATYWRITHVQVDCNARIIQAQLHGYLDEAARRAGRAPLHHIPYRFAAGDLPDPFTVSVADIYRAVREAPEGEDAAGAPLPSRFRDAADA
ncbi:hypothetical protein [Roseococcus thiosulfatophilus]|uniref:hypothetical protein n=1 Tax=Roseococcus thiosulfatophilus TaxID=35813 RepID=UPI001A8CD4F1|nr:hypothetical protein [Roseococcus thiosulfatophilus]